MEQERKTIINDTKDDSMHMTTTMTTAMTTRTQHYSEQYTIIAMKRG